MATTSSRAVPVSDRAQLLLAAVAAVTISAFAVFWFYSHGFTLYWGDAEAHLNVGRRIVEGRSTGYDQLGTPWLPLPHVLMLPLVVNDRLWRTGLAGAIPSACCFVAAALFLFAAVRRILGNGAAWCAAALLVLNPNALYLQSIPMTEAAFLAALAGTLFFTTRYRETQSLWDLAGASLLCAAATLTRYEGWIFVPASTVYVFVVSRKGRFVRALLFGAAASLGAAWWVFYNWWLSGNPLQFYNGPDSAMAIQAGKPYPGHGNWHLAIQYYLTASKLVLGWPLLWIGGIGVAAAFARRAVWPAVLLALWPMFMIYSIHSSSQPIHVPVLPPFSWYNTRYALGMLPLAALGAASLVSRGKNGALVSAAVILAGSGFWLFHADHQNWITWKESEQNSLARRPWTHAAAEYLEHHAGPGDTFFSTFGDLSGIFREAGIPFRRTLTWDDFPEWQAAVNRPDLFLWETWAIAQRGDEVDQTIERARKVGVCYDLATEINISGAKPVEIYHRHENPFR